MFVLFSVCCVCMFCVKRLCLYPDGPHSGQGHWCNVGHSCPRRPVSAVHRRASQTKRRSSPALCWGSRVVQSESGVVSFVIRELGRDTQDNTGITVGQIPEAAEKNRIDGCRDCYCCSSFNIIFVFCKYSHFPVDYSWYLCYNKLL